MSAGHNAVSCSFEWLDEALAVANADEACAELRPILQGTVEAMATPLSVAVAGVIKAGKSTLLNALLGEAVLPSAREVATYNVTVLEWAQTPRCMVHFKNERPPEEHPFAELPTLVARGGDIEFLQAVDYVLIGYPNPVLRQMRLIDTPGLGSLETTDSENTRRILEIARADSEIHAAKAEAIITVWKNNIRDSDDTLLSDFYDRSLGRANPLNAIAILNQVDLRWKAIEAHISPFTVARTTLERQMANPLLRQKIYAALPAAGLPAVGALELNQDELDLIKILAALEIGGLDGAADAADVKNASAISPLRILLVSAQSFTTMKGKSAAFDAVPSGVKQSLMSKIERWGIWTLVQAYRANPHMNPVGVLLRESGIAAVRDLVLRHFGNRAKLIKLNRNIPLIHQTLYALRARLDPADPARRGFDQIGSLLESFQTSDLDFAQLGVLQNHYAGALELTQPEIADLMCITGESGPAVYELLGCSATASDVELAAAAASGVARWAGIANGADERSLRTRLDAEVILRSYEKAARALRRA